MEEVTPGGTRGEAEIVLKELTLDFPTPNGKGVLRVFEDFNLSIERESFTILLGPSGCGKSTLLNVINGLVPATRAKAVQVFGKDIRQDPDITRQMGYVFQSPRLLPWRTLRQNILFGLKGLRVQPKDKWDSLADKYLAIVGLDEYANYFPHQLSGGMQQRAAIVRAWANEPRVLLMDEPFSHLDEITAGELRHQLIELWRREEPRRTIVFVTHDIKEAVQLGQRIVMLSQSPANIFHDETVLYDWPREETDETLFELEKKLRRIFFERVMSQSSNTTI